jgi:Mg/Co/Ni transporter MgtE
MPMTRVTSIAAGQVVCTGLLNLRRFEQRNREALAVGELLDRAVVLNDGSGTATVEDLAMSRARDSDWYIDQLFVRRMVPGKQAFGLRRRGSTLLVPADSVSGLSDPSQDQGASSLLAAYEGEHAADLAEALSELGDERREIVAAALDDERLADVLEELSEDDQAAIVKSLEPNRAADVLELMEPDDRADLLQEIGGEVANQLINLMEAEEAQEVRRLLAYGENTAGGLMTTAPVILGPEISVASALAQIRNEDLAQALAATVMVTRAPFEPPTGRFIGVVNFQRLLREPPWEAIGSFIEPHPEYLTADAPIGRITRLLATYDLLALPVLDDERRLLGVVSVDDVLDHILPDGWRDSDTFDDELHPLTGQQPVMTAVMNDG